MPIWLAQDRVRFALFGEILSKSIAFKTQGPLRSKAVLVNAFPIMASIFLSALAPSSTVAAKKALDDATALVLQGNADAAVSALAQVPQDQFSEKDGRIRACMIARLGNQSSLSERRADQRNNADAVRLLFEDYWRSSLHDLASEPANEERLKRGLAHLDSLPGATGWPELEVALRKGLAAQGVQLLLGRTPPLREFMAWRSQKVEKRKIALPGGPFEVKLNILDNFVSLGWTGFATCGRSLSGGWVKPDGIYAVRPGWKDLRDEQFAVSLLAHETQHFADKAEFGELADWELEYRAKLAELALAKTSLQDLLSAFASNQGTDPAVPHSYANRLVLAWVKSELGRIPDAVDDVSIQAINRAARALLQRDTARRRSSKVHASATR